MTPISHELADILGAYIERNILNHHVKLSQLTKLTMNILERRLVP